MAERGRRGGGEEVEEGGRFPPLSALRMAVLTLNTFHLGRDDEIQNSLYVIRGRGKASERGVRASHLHLREQYFDTFCHFSEVRHWEC